SAGPWLPRPPSGSLQINVKAFSCKLKPTTSQPFVFTDEWASRQHPPTSLCVGRRTKCRDRAKPWSSTDFKSQADALNAAPYGCQGLQLEWNAAKSAASTSR